MVQGALIILLSTPSVFLYQLILYQCFDLQDGRKFTGEIYRNESSSVLPLQGKENENGTYKCRWNSRGEARHRQFTVTVAFVALINETFSPPTYFNLSVIFAFLLAIGVGVGIKFYLSKVSEPKF